jgi:hypothetical protein
LHRDLEENEVANQAHSGIRGVPWSRCQRCGEDTPTDQLRLQTGPSHGGIRVCTINGCFDEPYPNEYRNEIIQSRLENSPDEMQLADILRTPPDPEDETIP